MSFDHYREMLNGSGDFHPENRIKGCFSDKRQGESTASRSRRWVDPEEATRIADRTFFAGVSFLSWWAFWTCESSKTNYRRLSDTEREFLEIANALGEEEAFARLTRPVGCGPI